MKSETSDFVEISEVDCTWFAETGGSHGSRQPNIRRGLAEMKSDFHRIVQDSVLGGNLSRDLWLHLKSLAGHETGSRTTDEFSDLQSGCAGSEFCYDQLFWSIT
jgi:hypothetical protein